MKTFTSSLALVLMAGMAMAFPPASQLQINLQNFRPHSVIVLNGKQFVSANNFVFIEALTPGDHHVQVLRPNAMGTHGVLFSGTVRVPRASHVTATINPTGMRVGSTPLAHHGLNYWDGYQHPPGAILHTPHHQPQLQPGFCGTPPAQGMHPDSFEQLKRTIRNQSFDSDQLRIAKQAVRLNGIYSHQMRQLMELMSFESTKLDLAKFGYQFVADPENYFIVNDVFWFSSSVTELDRFISGY